ncbi:enoyl-CoA hydratase/isomerase family protein [Variovorax sp. KK3]|uniref:enoyl-CoA hydratase/isomerase family protein n=1 Tax=Variovorax sp. KK3 TaxID=1855728 RepID=UPI00097C363F|nr:enoyl-CoA hydratase-related protein [Variovorax sp. KK3]
MSLPACSLESDLKEPSDIRVRAEGDVVFLTIDRSDEGNRLTAASLTHLKRLASELACDERTNCVVITGAGEQHFSLGIFNAELRACYSKADILKIVRLANEAFDLLEALPQLVIGALNGAVRAGGGELALACDFRLCASHATLGFHEMSYGCFPGAGAPVRLSRLIGAGRALEIMATGREVMADEMLRMGLVTGIEPAHALQERIRTMAVQIAAKPPLGPRGAKRVARLQATAGDDAAHQLSWALREALEYSEDVDEAIAAHREQRAGRYRGC